MRNVKTHLFILLCCLASVFALTFVACSSAQNTKPAASHVVSVDKTDSDGETDSYTVKFSDGSTYVFSADRNGGETSDGAYELFVAHTGYKGSEEEWLAALLDGTLFDTPDGRCVLKLRVSDDAGSAVVGAKVVYDGYTYLTSAEGKCNIMLDGGGELRVMHTAYEEYSEQIYYEDIASAGESMSLDVKLKTFIRDGKYKVRSENHMTFSVPAGSSTATYYWYVNYEPTGIRVSVDALDSDVVSDSPELGMNDNIEFVIQRNTSETGLSENNSFNVLATLGFDGMWARFANGANMYDGDISADLIAAGLLDVKRERKIKLTDGIDYTSVEVFIDYSVWNETYESAVGNFTIAPAARNGSKDGRTAFRSYVGHDCVWANASTNVRINKDGSFSENHFDLPDLNEEIKRIANYIEGSSLADGMAELSSKTAVVREYGKDVPLFTDRLYFASGLGLPDALDGSAYLYGALDIPRDFKAESAGYAVVAVPGEGSFKAGTASYLASNGFEKIASGLPAVGHGTGMTVIEEHFDYYAKYCEVGEEYTLPKYGVVFTRALEDYEKNNWETVAAKVTVLDTDELKAKYAPSTRLWQGIPSIERVEKADGSDRLYACWFTGSTNEPKIGNYAVVYYSDDKLAWNPAFVIGMEDGTPAATDSRVFDPTLFVDDDNNLWLWWNQTGELFAEVTSWYAKVTDSANGDVNSFKISEPVMTSYGLRMNKPTKLSTGEWLYCAHDFTDVGKTKVYSSVDKGVTWTYKGSAKVPNARFANETALAENIRDGKSVLIMWNRCTHSYNIAVSYSYDLGATWTDGEEFNNLGPSSRVNARTLPSGNILYVHHYNTEGRNNLCAFLSTDGGKSFSHALVLDTRYDVSYPDIALVGNGKIYIVWDYNRYIDKQILMTEITESELLSINGTKILDSSRITTVSSLTLGNEQTNISVAVNDGSAPVSGATVTLSAPFAADITAVTDEYGIALFDEINAEEYVVSVVKNGYYDGSAGLTVAQYIDAMFIGIDLTVTLEETEYATVRGVITDMFTGEAVSGAAVTAGGKTATSGADGGYVIENVRTDADTITVSANGYKCENVAVAIESADFKTDIALVDSRFGYLGQIGGATSTAGISTLLWQLYAARDADGLKLAAVGDKAVPSDGGQTQLEFFVNVGEFGTVRTANTGVVDFLSSKSTRAFNFPSNTQKSVFGLADNTANGIALAITGNVMTAEITYAALSGVCGNYAINADTPLGFTFLAGVKSGSWYYIEWQGENTAIDGLTGAVRRFNPSLYLLLKADGTVSTLARTVDSVAELDALVSASAVGKPDTPLSENMAAFDISSPDTVLRTVKTGNYMFDDRTTHCFNGKQLKAVEGMSFLYDGVLENSSVTVTKAGYLLMYATSNAAVGGEWTRIVAETENPGIVTSAGIALYALWAEVGDTVSVINDGLLMTNGIETELLVFGDSYTDAHVRRFWKSWNETMAPYGAKTIGISGSRIATPTNGDSYGWIARAQSGEINAYNPKKMLINLGVNDIDNGVDGHESATALIGLLSILREQLPNTDIYYTLIVDNRMFLSRAGNYLIHNTRVRAFVESDESGKLHVIDFRDKLYVSVNGIKTLDPNMFADNLHLSAAGYALWESEIRRVIFDSDGV